MKFPSLALHTLIVLAATTLPAPVMAEPFPITSGFLSSQGLSNIGVFQLKGPGLRLGGNTDMGNVSPSSCFPCAAGTAVPLGALFMGRLETGGPVLVDSDFFGPFEESVFEFSALDVVMPSTRRDFSVRRPFTFTGSLIARDSGDISLLFRLIGQGQLTANFAYKPNLDDPAAFEFTSIRYDFSEAAPVPEPVTMLLVGTGLGSVILRRRQLRTA
jgi:hypothetical protein